MMLPDDRQMLKDNLTDAFEHFGPDAIERGMRAFPFTEQGLRRPTMCACFLGFTGAMSAEPEVEELIESYARIKGCDDDGRYNDHAIFLEDAYEGRGYLYKTEVRQILHDLATEWLELQRTLVPCSVQP